MPEDIGSISSSRLSGADLSRHTFTTVRRGFDVQEVRSYLEQVARELAAAEQREEDLRKRLAEAEERAEHPVIDESTLTTALGQQSAQVLRNAHEEAARITLQAEETSAALVRDAQRLAADVHVQAESAAAERIAEAEIARRAINHQAEQEVGLLQEASRAEAEALLARGIEQGQEMVEQAQETRRRVLVDMAHRRRVMTLQIEQFRAARDELAAAVSGVRDSVDAVLEDLARADDSARAAAADVARRQPAEPTTAEIMAEVDDVQAALDVTRARAHEAAREQARDETVEVTTAVFDVAVEDPATGATVVEEVEVTVVEAGVEEGEGEGEGPSDTVEGLFARLRAGQPEDAGEAVEEGGPATENGATAGPGEEGAATEPGGEGSGDTVPQDGDAEPDPDGPLRSKRAQALDPIAEQLAKRLKRALQDDQNLLLDRLRVGSGAWSAEVLPTEDEQRALYADAAASSLREATAAGIAFAREERGERRGRGPSPDAKAVVSMADRLAGTVVALLRRRLEDAEDGPDGGGAERVGAAYREWRGERIERLVGDWALEAFSSGVLSASGTGGGLRWVVGGDEPSCADCDDNALAGAVPAGDEFPTGHLHPPAHAGCRCLVVPTPA